MNQLFLAVDGNSLMHRAFHAMGDLTDERGNPTGAVFGFMGMLLKVLSERQPAYGAVAFDMHGPTFRHLAYDAYKGTRKPTDENLRVQFPVVKGLLEMMGIPVLEVPEFEADDILGTLAARCEKCGIPALLVTGDRDAMQLVTESTHVLYTKRGISDTEEFDPALVLSTFGVEPKHVPDLKGLMGDSSDNIPGVPGVGEKTAVKLLSEYKDVEGVLENIEAQKGALKKKLEEGKESALQSKWLATISKEAPIEKSVEECLLGNLSGGRDLFVQLGFKSLLTRLDKLCASRGEKGEVQAEIPEETGIIWGDEIVLYSREEVENLAQSLSEAALHWGEELTVADGKNCYRIALQKDLLSSGLEAREAFEALSKLFQKKEALRLFGAKRLLREMEQMGLVFDGMCVLDDAQLAGWLLNPLSPPKTLEGDAKQIWSLCLKQRRELEEMGMTDLYRNMEIPLMRVLLRMERRGFCVSREELERQGGDLSAQEAQLKADIYELTGETFNINSPKQLGEVLFEKLQLPAGRKTSRGWSTDAETLENLAPLHPAVEKILDYRKVTKLRATYIDGLLQALGTDGRVRSSFDQIATVTGRLSSNEPNLQNIPVRTPQGREIRKAFLPREGWTLVDADYSQIELRILAHLSNDPSMIQAFRDGADIHTATAAEVYEVEKEKVTSAMRSAAKAVNFGIVYGISDFGLARNIGVTRKEAAEFIQRYFDRYPGVKRFMDEAVQQGKSQGFAQTIFARRRPLPELSSSNYNVRSFGERAAMNTPVQGAAADIIKLAMIRVEEEIEKRNLQARLILQVHDELIVESPVQECEEVQEILRSCMENVASLQVPLAVEVQTGGSWYEAK